MSLTCTVSEMLVETCQFEPTLPLFGARIGCDPIGICRGFWHQKTRIHGLSYGVVCVILRLLTCFGTILPCDRRMDGQKHDDSIYHASIASRGKVNADQFVDVLLFDAVEF